MNLVTSVSNIIVMKEHYFIVFELPGGAELKFEENEGSPCNFWRQTAEMIKNGRAKIISKRKDTGISEELRSHVQHNNKFTTYVLAHLMLGNCNEKDIFKKVAQWLTSHKHETVIDTADNFQLVTIES